MADIASFKAIRPIRDKVHLVATKPYYFYKKNVLKAKLQSNPFTFLRIINPEFGNKIKTKPNSNKRFEMVRDRYKEFIDKYDLLEEKDEEKKIIFEFLDYVLQDIGHKTSWGFNSSNYAFVEYDKCQENIEQRIQKPIVHHRHQKSHVYLSEIGGY